MLKSFSKLGTEEELSQLDKDCLKLTYFNDEKLEVLPLRSGARQGFSLPPLIFNTVLKILMQYGKERK